MFIALYGINNIGKSTQAKLLAEKLKESSKNVEYMKYPLYDIEPTGPMINRFLRDPDTPKASPEELQMWYTLNRFQGQAALHEMLEKDTTVVAEDYTGTGIAWGMTHGADKKWLEEINSYLVKEDLSILLDGDQFQTERETQHMNEGHDELIVKCRQIHLDLAKEYGWKIVDASGSVEEVSDRIWACIS